VYKRQAYYFQGQTLTGKGRTSEDDSYSQNYQRLDVSIRQKLPIEGLSAHFLWNNITGVPDESYIWKSNFNIFEEYYGASGSLGVKYEF
jgi:hypothetical protein